MNGYSMRVKEGYYRIFKEGVRKSVAQIMIIKGEACVVGAHWNMDENLALEIFNKLK